MDIQIKSVQIRVKWRDKKFLVESKSLKDGSVPNDLVRTLWRKFLAEIKITDSLKSVFVVQITDSLKLLVVHVVPLFSNASFNRKLATVIL